MAHRGRLLAADDERYPSERRCPDCDAPCVVRDGGCPTCHACGWSACAYSPP